MILALMLYAILVSVLVFAAGRALEEVCRLAGLATRYVWLGALLATAALVALAPVRSGWTAPAPSAPADLAALPVGAGPGVDGTGTAGVAELLRVIRGALEWPLQTAAPLGDAPPVATVLPMLWLALSFGLLCLGSATVVRYRRTRRSWPLRDVAGTRVRVAPAAGPAVVGLLRPEIVVPERLLRASPEEQRLVVLHEREHLRAGDPVILAVGCVVAALLPWNPLVWWGLLRLRLAVELDCDARVLRGGVRPQTYGTMLIEMAGRGSGLPLSAAALAGSPSTLNRRITAMTRRLPRFRTLRASGLAAVAGTALLTACETALPTSAEVEAMDVASVETQAQRLQLLPHHQENVVYMIDGEEVTAEDAHALLGDRIAEIAVVRGSTAEGATIRIRTKPADAEPTMREGGDAREVVGEEIRILKVRATEGTGSAAGLGTPLETGEFGGLVVIDGVVTESSALRSVRPEQIESVEVIKGEAARQLFDDARAERGVIRVTTKGG